MAVYLQKGIETGDPRLDEEVLPAGAQAGFYPWMRYVDGKITKGGDNEHIFALFMGDDDAINDGVKRHVGSSAKLVEKYADGVLLEVKPGDLILVSLMRRQFVFSIKEGGVVSSGPEHFAERIAQHDPDCPVEVTNLGGRKAFVAGWEAIPPANN